MQKEMGNKIKLEGLKGRNVEEMETKSLKDKIEEMQKKWKTKAGKILWQKCRRDGKQKKLEGFRQKCTRRDGKQRLQGFWQECSRDGNPKKELPGFWQTCRRIRDGNKSFLRKDSARIIQEMETLKNKSLKGSGRNVEEMEKTKAA